jgi:hypothetical protein
MPLQYHTEINATRNDISLSATYTDGQKPYMLQKFLNLLKKILNQHAMTFSACYLYRRTNAPDVAKIFKVFWIFLKGT